MYGEFRKELLQLVGSTEFFTNGMLNNDVWLRCDHCEIYMMGWEYRIGMNKCQIYYLTLGRDDIRICMVTEHGLSLDVTLSYQNDLLPKGLGLDVPVQRCLEEIDLKLCELYPAR